MPADEPRWNAFSIRRTLLGENLGVWGRMGGDMSDDSSSSKGCRASSSEADESETGTHGVAKREANARR